MRGFAGRLNGKIGLAVALSIAIASGPAAAQFSKSYNFLKAVRDADGQKVEDTLKQAGATILNTKDTSTGEGALHIVVKRRDATYLQFLLAKGATPDLRDRDGNTPLMAAAQIGFIDGITQLIAYGANINLANNRGETALILAVQSRDAPTVRALVASGANPMLTDRVAGLSARDYAAQDKRSNMILKILDEAPKQKPAADVAGPKL